MPALEDLAVEDQPKEALTLPRKSYTVFRCMFPETIEERKKSVDWITFLSAMENAGFSVETRNGLAVTFEWPERGRILFHRPHPEPTIDSVMLKSTGKRLSKSFGWIEILPKLHHSNSSSKIL